MCLGFFVSGLFGPRLFWARGFFSQGFLGPGPFWVWVFLGPGLIGPGLIWAQAYLGQGLFWPGPSAQPFGPAFWPELSAWAYLGPGFLEPGLSCARAFLLIWARTNLGPGLRLEFSARPFGPSFRPWLIWA